ncbi:MAG TPA: hypothetical protein PL097_07055 [Dysgonamonadaceae bacterium]|nr:hypothetical protein [Dysgonamonadaceae bacterium]HRU13827.1 hypothetical protein [Dysgonamonadaceae bacterium]
MWTKVLDIKHKRLKDSAKVSEDETIELEYVPEDEWGKRQNQKTRAG